MIILLLLLLLLLTKWSRVLLQKLTVTQLPFVELKGLLLQCSQEPATGPYPKPDEFSPHLPTLPP